MNKVSIRPKLILILVFSLSLILIGLVLFLFLNFWLGVFIIILIISFINFTSFLLYYNNADIFINKINKIIYFCDLENGQWYG